MKQIVTQLAINPIVMRKVEILALELFISGLDCLIDWCEPKR